ncbi:MAG: hypothetical protein KAI03_02755 [Candidatus Aureabacteria bacterium]|nr:hypothetical protein [Candidatus Auribacterota bacterium]
MSKIAIIEEERKVDPSKFDKVISFCRDGYPNVDNYIVEDDSYRIADQVYLELDSWLKQDGMNSNFVYQDIDILHAYRKKIFNFLSNFYQKIHIAKKIIEKESPSEIWVAKASVESNSKYPFLSMFLPDFVSPDISIRYFEDLPAKKSNSINPKKLKLYPIRFILDLIRRFSNIVNQSKADNILICSDLEKIPTIMGYFKKENVIFMREDFPERLVFYLIGNCVSLRLFSDFKVSGKHRESVSDVKNDFIRKLNNLLPDKSVSGVNFTPYVKKFLAVIWQKDLMLVLMRAAQINSLFGKFKMKSLLVDEDSGVFTNILVQTAKKYQCMSYVNCHSEPFHKNGIVPLTADYILVWGKSQKELLMNWGMEESKIIVTGCSKYDKYIRVSSESIKAKICGDLGFNVSRPVGLIATCPLKKRRNVLENTLWQEIKQVIVTASSFPDIQIIIKLHPGDYNEPFVRDLVKNLNSDKVKVLRNYDPLALAKGVDFLIVCASTFTIDGLAYGKPVILTYNRCMKRYKDLGVFYDGTGNEKLKNSIEGILNGSYRGHMINWESAVNYCLDGMDGLASERIAGILQKGYKKQ